MKVKIEGKLHYRNLENKMLRKGLQEKDYLIYLKNISGAHVMA